MPWTTRQAKHPFLYQLGHWLKPVMHGYDRLLTVKWSLNKTLITFVFIYLAVSTEIHCHIYYGFYQQVSKIFFVWKNEKETIYLINIFCDHFWRDYDWLSINLKLINFHFISIILFMFGYTDYCQCPLTQLADEICKKSR